MEASCHLDHGGLAAAGLANQGKGGPGRDVEAEVVQDRHIWPGWVLKHDAPQLDVAHHRRQLRTSELLIYVWLPVCHVPELSAWYWSQCEHTP